MPLYEYRCGACGAQEERLQGLSAPDRHDCPQCEAPLGMRRQVSVAAFALSGGGWYKQGYGTGTAAAKGDPGPSEAAKEAPAAKPDAKPSGGCAGGCACHPS